MLWEYENGTNVRVVSSLPAHLDDNEWHQVGVVRDATRKRLEFYVDGAALGLAGSYVRNPTGASRGMLYLGADIAEKQDAGTGAGEWIWSDGSEVTYTAWASGEPNDWGGNQDCGVMNWGGSVEEDWDDLGCDEVRPFICQGREIVAATPDTGDTGAVLEESLDCTAMDYAGEVTLFCTAGRNWADAHAACLARGLDLVSIQTADEQAWLVEQGDLIGSYSWFMGLRERESVGSIDEVCIYDRALDASQMSRLGEMEDCVTVLEPLPESPPEADTSASEDADSGEFLADDSGTSAADEDAFSEAEEDPEVETSETEEMAAVGDEKKGTGCAHAADVQLRWLWLLFIGAVFGRQDRGCR